MKRIAGLAITALLLFATAAASADFELRLISQTSSKITLGWDRQDDVVAYVFYADGRRVSHTFDGTRTSVTFSKVAGCVTGCYAVEDLHSDGKATYPDAASPPPPAPPPPPPGPTTISGADFAQALANGTRFFQDVTVTGSITVNVPDVRMARVNVQGSVKFEGNGHRGSFDQSTAGGLYIFGVDDTHVTNSIFDGHAFGTTTQNLVWEQPVGAVPERTVITDNTFQNFYGSPTDHSEALFIGYSNVGLIEGNTFTNNGSTAHIFFSYWSASASSSKRAQNWCVKGNTFGPTVTAYFSIDWRSEIQAGDNNRVDPNQSTVRGLTSRPEFNGVC